MNQTVESEQMLTVVRKDPEGRLYLDGLCTAFDSQGVVRQVGDLHALCPEYATFSPIQCGPNGERFALVEVKFIKWSE